MSAETVKFMQVVMGPFYIITAGNCKNPSVFKTTVLELLGKITNLKISNELTSLS